MYMLCACTYWWSAFPLHMLAKSWQTTLDACWPHARHNMLATYWPQHALRRDKHGPKKSFLELPWTPSGSFYFASKSSLAHCGVVSKHFCTTSRVGLFKGLLYLETHNIIKFSDAIRKYMIAIFLQTSQNFLYPSAFWLDEPLSADQSQCAKKVTLLLLFLWFKFPIRLILKNGFCV